MKKKIATLLRNWADRLNPRQRIDMNIVSDNRLIVKYSFGINDTKDTRMKAAEEITGRKPEAISEDYSYRLFESYAQDFIRKGLCQSLLRDGLVDFRQKGDMYVGELCIAVKDPKIKNHG